MMVGISQSGVTWISVSGTTKDYAGGDQDNSHDQKQGDVESREGKAACFVEHMLTN